ncbi:DNA-binding protein H-NS [Rahnella inusitata]|nr:DNA-binding protein H-NS [Rahnella inusitata]
MMQLKAFITDAQGVLDDRIEEEKRSLEAEAEKQELIRQHLESLKKDGITPGDISPYLRKKKPSIGPVKKYLIDGETITYKGAGRMPAKLKALVEHVGREGLEKYEIQNAK